MARMNAKLDSLLVLEKSNPMVYLGWIIWTVCYIGGMAADKADYVRPSTQPTLTILHHKRDSPP